MTVARTATTVTAGLFTFLAGLTALVALYHWLVYLVLWGTTWDLAGALMWTTFAIVLFAPVIALHFLTGRGD